MGVVLNLFQLARNFFEAEAPSVPDHLRVYAIGDIHGRLDLLHEVMLKIREDVNSLSEKKDIMLVFLGDYIDRGMQSREVIDYLITLSAQTEYQCNFLRGNHEAMLLDFLSYPKTLSAWQNFGGLETLNSYGLRIRELFEEREFEQAQEALMSLMPQEHYDFYASTITKLEIGDYFFCHAGVKPGVDLADQEASDLLWIRDEFLESTINHGKMIIHGHTPVEKAEIWSNRINIDTGAYITNNLTCLILNEKEKMCI